MKAFFSGIAVLCFLAIATGFVYDWLAVSSVSGFEKRLAVQVDATDDAR